MVDIPVQSIPALARKRIRELINHHGYNRDRICKEIGISKNNLCNLIAKKHAGNMYADMVLAEAGYLLDRLGQTTAHQSTGGDNMDTQSEQQHGKQQAIKNRLKAYRVSQRLSWCELSDLIGFKRLDVFVAPSSKPTASRIRDIEDALDALEKNTSTATTSTATVTQAHQHDADPVYDAPSEHKAKHDIATADESETHAVIDITHDSAVMEAAQDLIVATVGIDLDELKKLAPTIDKLLAASQLGLDVSLHIAGGQVKL